MVVRGYRLRSRMCEFPVAEMARPWGVSRFRILPTGIQLAKSLVREFGRAEPLRHEPETASGEIPRAFVAGE
jgi:hypothetical protein